jgi:hypothetical protein
MNLLLLSGVASFLAKEEEGSGETPLYLIVVRVIGGGKDRNRFFNSSRLSASAIEIVDERKNRRLGEWGNGRMGG